ncbi:MAG: hypothetical protein ABWX74_18445 [Aeromicrobium sp.]
MTFRTIAGLVAAAALAAGASIVAAGPATADGENYPTATQDYTYTLDGSSGRIIAIKYKQVEAKTMVDVQAYSCGKLVGSEPDQDIHTTGSEDVAFVILGDNYGPTQTITTTVNAPGRTTHVTSFEYELAGSKPCDQVTDIRDVPKQITSTHIKKWSKKKGHKKARLGQTLKVTKTYLKPAGKGMKVRYRWYAGKKVVDKDRSVKVSRKYTGKKLKLKVTISKPGYKARTKTLSYGKVKK